MKFEIVNTLFSCLPPYQKGVHTSDYSIIVVDNRSTDSVNLEDLRSLSDNIRVEKFPFSTNSPAPALNWAVRHFAKSEYLLMCIDGARMFSDSLIRKTLEVHRMLANAFVYTIGFHIGPKTHQVLAKEGFSIEAARLFLKNLNWIDNPKKLKENSVYALSSNGGYFAPIAESNAFAIKRSTFEIMGGFDERFTSPGGGLCNLEIFKRFVTCDDLVNVCLLEEGTYHQFHGGAATGGVVDHHLFWREYQDLFKAPYSKVDYPRFYF